MHTGVTAILPRGKASHDTVMAGWFSPNGSGEMTGTTWIEEAGFLEGPIMITSTHSGGLVHDAVIKWRVRHGHLNRPWSLPVVAETYDGYLNDVNGFHIRDAHVFHALDSAAGGPIAEGNVKAERARPRGDWRHPRAATPSACWCRRIMDCAINCASPACRLAWS